MVTLEVKREITDLVQEEIDAHRAGDRETFTTYIKLAKEYNVSRESVGRWVRAAVSDPDLQYRTLVFKPHDFGGPNTPVLSRVPIEHVSEVNAFLEMPDCSEEDDDLQNALSEYGF